MRVISSCESTAHTPTHSLIHSFNSPHIVCTAQASPPTPTSMRNKRPSANLPPYNKPITTTNHHAHTCACATQECALCARVSALTNLPLTPTQWFRFQAQSADDAAVRTFAAHDAQPAGDPDRGIGLRAGEILRAHHGHVPHAADART